ncbi:MAG: RAD55 family ATPase [Candidatus Helarchaeota archaeon]
MGNLNNSIPEEILNSFKGEQGFSLLIKGDAGTGKTTLALEILARMPNAIYISSRVSPQSLFNQFPWIRNIPKENIFDGTQIEVNYPDRSRKDAFINAVKFRNVPDFIKLIYAKADEVKPNKTTIVVDSWDAILGAIVHEWEKRNIPGVSETILAELTRQMNINLILITETYEGSFLDYIVDGIIKMEKFEYDGKRMRTLTIEKLRGVTINNFKYLFTLKDGRFYFFKPLPKIKNILQKIVVKPTALENKIGTGIEDFNRLIGGGFPINSRNMFIVDKTVGSDYIILLYSLILNHIKNKKGILQILSIEANNFDLINVMKNLIKELNIDDYYKIIKSGLFEEKEIELTENSKSYLDLLKSYLNKEINDCKLHNKIPLLIIYDIDMVELLIDSHNLLKYLINVSNEVKKIPHIEFIIIKSSQQYAYELINWTDYTFYIFKYQNNVLIRGKLPETVIFGFDLKELKDNSVQLNLLPIL